ncbi:hypothetical protein B0H17DRAFT_1148393 [Mycena rosella]|uniref:Uncharacterized protein n=1 Tax=Mycena rosella TaxID=1033263 RepID=A0AAD7CDL4_MYCRO|nr:hypothetical protein B0H17DRAFT_1148393 [Mycena rosella]
MYHTPNFLKVTYIHSGDTQLTRISLRSGGFPDRAFPNPERRPTRRKIPSSARNQIFKAELHFAGCKGEAVRAARGRDGQHSSRDSSMGPPQGCGKAAQRMEWHRQRAGVRGQAGSAVWAAARGKLRLARYEQRADDTGSARTLRARAPGVVRAAWGRYGQCAGTGGVIRARYGNDALGCVEYGGSSTQFCREISLPVRRSERSAARQRALNGAVYVSQSSNGEEESRNRRGGIYLQLGTLGAARSRVAGEIRGSAGVCRTWGAKWRPVDDK